MRKRTQARECALQILYQWEMNPSSTREIFHDFWAQNPMNAEVKQFAEAIVHGTLARIDELDRVIKETAQNWELSRMATIDRCILRFGTYELLFEDDIPPKVTINEAVNLAKKFSQGDSGKFVNGVLDKINHTMVQKENKK